MTQVQTNPVATAPGTDCIAERLLADRELISLDRARLNLAGRARTRTPLGAVEYLELKKDHAAAVYQKRLQLAIDLMEIYRIGFTEAYARSAAPFYSTQREHELYRLIHLGEQAFPLVLPDDFVADGTFDLLEVLEREPRFFFPFIPVRGVQTHHWAPGHFKFEEIDLPFQLVIALTWLRDDEAKSVWARWGLKETPAPPLAAIGWGEFTYSLSIEESPLRFLATAFNLVAYKTNNPWLDLPPAQFVMNPVEWSLENVAFLSLAWAYVKDADAAMRQLHNWFLEDPAKRLGRAIELWNHAAKIEAESDYSGMMIEDMIETGDAQPIGGGMALLLRRPAWALRP